MAQIAYVDWDGLIYYDKKIKKHITDKLEACVKDGGKLLFEKLKEPKYELLNYVYVIEDDFITDNRFPIPGLSYRAGTAVKVSEISPSVYGYTIFNEYISDSDAEKLNDLTSRISEVETSLAESQETISNIKETLASHAEDITDIEASLSDVVRTKDLEDYVDETTLNTSLNGINNSINSINAAITTLNNSIGELPSRVTSAESKICELEKSAVDEDDVKNAIANALGDIDLSDYYTKDEVDDLVTKINSGGSIDLDGYVSESEWEEWIKDYATTEALNDYLKNSEFDAKLAANADYKQLKAAVAGIEIPEKVSDLQNDVGYITADELSKKGYVTDISGKADKSDTYTKSEVDGLIPTDYLTADALNDYAKTEDIPTDYLVASDLNGYAKTEDLPSLEGYAKSSDIPDVSDFITMSDIPSIPTKTSELTNDSGFLTAQDISGKLDIEDYNSDKQTFNSALASKANDVLFTKDYKVFQPIGSFEFGESLKDLSLTDILIKLLDLQYNFSLSFDATEYDYYIDDIILGVGKSLSAGDIPQGPQKLGYTFDGWYDEDGVKLTAEYRMPERHVTMSPRFKPNEDTIYRIKYYLETLDGQYTLHDEKEHEGVTDQNISIDNPSEIKHFKYNAERSTSSGIISADGSLVLTLYYDREIYYVDVVIDPAAGGEVYGNETGEYKYQHNCEFNAVARDGYIFNGWYDQTDNLLSNEAEYTFTVKANITLTAKFDVVEEPEQPDGPDQEVTVELVKDKQIPVLQSSFKMSDGSTTDNQKSTYAYIELSEETMVEAPEAAEPGTSVLYEVKNDDGEVIEHGYQIYTIASGRGTCWRVSLPSGLVIKNVQMYDGLRGVWGNYNATFADTGDRIESDGYLYIVYQSNTYSNKEILRFVLE